jgi:hypothetical protein
MAAAEVERLLAVHRQRDAINLCSVGKALMVFAPRRLLGETYEIRTGDAVMVAYLAPPFPGEEAFGVIRVGLSLVAETVGFLVVDPPKL